MPENYDLLMQRIFSQMDRNSDTIESMGETLHKHSGIIRVLLGVVITIFLFLLTLGLNSLINLPHAGDKENGISVNIEDPEHPAAEHKTVRVMKEVK